MGMCLMLYWIRLVGEAGVRFLRSAEGMGQFTTLVGDVPERPMPSAGDNFRTGLRSFRFGSNDNGAGNAGVGNGDEGNAEVGYAWVSVAQHVDGEGEDTLASV